MSFDGHSPLLPISLHLYQKFSFTTTTPASSTGAIMPVDGRRRNPPKKERDTRREELAPGIKICSKNTPTHFEGATWTRDLPDGSRSDHWIFHLSGLFFSCSFFFFARCFPTSTVTSKDGGSLFWDVVGFFFLCHARDGVEPGQGHITAHPSRRPDGPGSGNRGFEHGTAYSESPREFLRGRAADGIAGCFSDRHMGSLRHGGASGRDNN